MRKPAAAQSKELLGVGKALRSGQRPSDSFERPIKLDRGPAETMLKPAAAQSKELLAMGKGLRSGQGAIRQFWNPIKPDRGPAEIP